MPPSAITVLIPNTDVAATSPPKGSAGRVQTEAKSGPASDFADILEEVQSSPGDGPASLRVGEKAEEMASGKMPEGKPEDDLDPESQSEDPLRLVWGALLTGTSATPSLPSLASVEQGLLVSPQDVPLAIVENQAGGDLHSSSAVLTGNPVVQSTQAVAGSVTPVTEGLAAGSAVSGGEPSDGQAVNDPVQAHTEIHDAPKQQSSVAPIPREVSTAAFPSVRRIVPLEETVQAGSADPSPAAASTHQSEAGDVLETLAESVQQLSPRYILQTRGSDARAAQQGEPQVQIARVLEAETLEAGDSASAPNEPSDQIPSTIPAAAGSEARTTETVRRLKATADSERVRPLGTQSLPNPVAKPDGISADSRLQQHQAAEIPPSGSISTRPQGHAESDQAAPTPKSDPAPKDATTAVPPRSADPVASVTPHRKEEPRGDNTAAESVQTQPPAGGTGKSHANAGSQAAVPISAPAAADNSATRGADGLSSQSHHEVSEPPSGASVDLLEKIVAQGKLLRLRNFDEITLQLKPENLGRVLIKAALEDGRLLTQISVESRYVERFLNENLNWLRDSLGDLGLKIHRVDVVGSAEPPASFGSGTFSQGHPQTPRSAAPRHKVSALPADEADEEIEAPLPAPTNRLDLHV